MADSYRVVKAYSIHGHVRAGSESEELLSYDQFFRSLYEIDRAEASVEVRGRTVALARQALPEGLLAFQLVAGSVDNRALVLELGTGEVSEQRAGRGRIFVGGSWLVYEPGNRIVAVEANRAGISKDVVERFLGSMGERLGYERLSISLNPVPAESFRSEIEQLTRIRIARITLKRPNGSWTDGAEDLLGQIAKSNAGKVQVQANADRGESLARDSGIVKEVLDIANSKTSPVANASVVGTSPTVEGEQTISLERHNLRRSAPVAKGASGAAILNAVVSAAQILFASKG